jgi:acyl dehydratase
MKIHIDELPSCVGQHVGYSEWFRVTQAQVDKFAEATGYSVDTRGYGRRA